MMSRRILSGFAGLAFSLLSSGCGCPDVDCATNVRMYRQLPASIAELEGHALEACRNGDCLTGTVINDLSTSEANSEFWFHFELARTFDRSWAIRATWSPRGLDARDDYRLRIWDPKSGVEVFAETRNPTIERSEADGICAVSCSSGVL